jgi:hypothetical protein
MKAAILAAASSSAAIGKKYVVTGVGQNTCGALLKDYRETPDLAEIAYTQWTAGFLSGTNFACAKQTYFDGAAGSAFLVKWCGDNPLKVVAAAAHAMRAELVGPGDSEHCQ